MNASLRTAPARRSALVLGGLLGGAALVACQVLAGLELPAFVPADGRSDAGAPERPDAGVLDLACDPVIPKARPTSSGGGDLPTTLFAIEALDFPTTLELDRARLCEVSALDLDGYKTCEEVDAGNGVTRVDGNSCISRGAACDKPRGGDSALTSLATLNLGQKPSPDQDPNVLLRDGKLGLLVEVSDYNGKDDDGTVTVAFMSAVGVTRADGGLPYGDGGGGGLPLRDGGDTWAPEARAFITDDRPAYVIKDAFVVGGVLVAPFRQQTPFNIGGSATDIVADEVVITARIVRDEAGVPYRLDQGRVAGRVPASTIWTYAAGRLSGGKSVCDDSSEAAVFRAFVTRDICEAFDLASGAGAVRPNEPCDAISFSAGFYAVRAARTSRPVKGPTPNPPPDCPSKNWPPVCPDGGAAN